MQTAEETKIRVSSGDQARARDRTAPNQDVLDFRAQLSAINNKEASKLIKRESDTKIPPAVKNENQAPNDQKLKPAVLTAKPSEFEEQVSFPS